MPWKMDGDKIEVKDGNPVWIHEDKKEVPFDAGQTLSTISRLNGEAKGHREAKEAAEVKLKTFEGIEDPVAAKAAIETVKNIKDGDLLTAGKVEEIKAAARKAAEEQVASVNKKAAEDLAAANKKTEELTGQLYSEKIGGSFSRSKFITDKIAIPPDMLQARFGQNFKVEEGKIVAYDSSGNKVFSRARPGEIADFDEAIEFLVDAYPNRDNILKGTGGGSGGRQGGGGGGGGGGEKKLTRAEFDKLDPGTKSSKLAEGFAVVDA